MGVTPKKPTELLADVIEGRTHVTDASKAIQSWFSGWVIQRAGEVVEAGGINQRREQLAAMPIIHQAAIKEQAIRLFDLKKQRLMR